LYKKLLDPSLSTSSKQVMFINLLFNAMKKDPAVNRVKAFIKRLLQVK
jgi:ribosome biogenesis protein MAK21